MERELAAVHRRPGVAEDAPVDVDGSTVELAAQLLNRCEQNIKLFASIWARHISNVALCCAQVGLDDVTGLREPNRRYPRPVRQPT